MIRYICGPTLAVIGARYGQKFASPTWRAASGAVCTGSNPVVARFKAIFRNYTRFHKALSREAIRRQTRLQNYSANGIVRETVPQPV